MNFLFLFAQNIQRGLRGSWVLALFTAPLLVQLNSHTAHAGVLTLSTAQSVTDMGIKIEKTIVQCDSGSHPRLLVKAGKSAQWCDTEVSGFCHGERMVAAEKVCTASYTKSMKANGGNTHRSKQVATMRTKSGKKDKLDSATVANLKRELLEIKESLIEIQQAQLALREQKLKLNRQKQTTLLSASR